jgi:hypothetical protein
MLKTKELTPAAYAKIKNCSTQNITKHLRANNKLDGVIRVKKYSRFYVLIVDNDFESKKPRT